MTDDTVFDELVADIDGANESYRRSMLFAYLCGMLLNNLPSTAWSHFAVLLNIADEDGNVIGTVPQVKSMFSLLDNGGKLSEFGMNLKTPSEVTVSAMMLGMYMVCLEMSLLSDEQAHVCAGELEAVFDIDFGRLLDAADKLEAQPEEEGGKKRWWNRG